MSVPIGIWTWDLTHLLTVERKHYLTARPPHILIWRLWWQFSMMSQGILFRAFFLLFVWPRNCEDTLTILITTAHRYFFFTVRVCFVSKIKFFFFTSLPGNFSKKAILTPISSIRKLSLFMLFQTSRCSRQVERERERERESRSLESLAMWEEKLRNNFKVCIYCQCWTLTNTS